MKTNMALPAKRLYPSESFDDMQAETETDDCQFDNVSLAKSIIAGSTDPYYAVSMHTVFGGCSPDAHQKIGTQKIFNDPAVQKEMITAIVTGAVIKPDIFAHLKSCNCALDASTQIEIMHEISAEKLQNLLQIPDVNEILFKFFEENSCRTQLTSINDAVIHRDMLITTGNTATSDEVRCSVADEINFLAQEDAGSALFANSDVRDMFVAMGNTATSDQAKSDIAGAIVILVQGNLATQTLFNIDTIRDMLIKMGKTAILDETKINISAAIEALTYNSLVGQALFSTELTRDMFIAMGSTASNDASEWIAGAIVNIAGNPIGKTIFCTPIVRNMIIAMGNDATSDEAIINITGAICALIKDNPAGQALFGADATQEMLIAMWNDATSNTAKHNIAGAIAILFQNIGS
jgi:hypothetical protein